MQNRSGQKVSRKAGLTFPGAPPALFSLNPVPMAIADPETLEVIDVNQSFEGVTGCARSQLVGQPLGALSKGEALSLASAPGAHPREIRLCGRDVLGSAMRVEIGGRPCLLACIQDVTEQKKTLASLDRMKTLLDREEARREKAECLLKEREKELQEMRREFEEVNTALRILRRQTAEDRAEVEKSLLANVKTTILPFLEKLKCTPLNESQKCLLWEIEGHMHDITSPFVRELSCGHLGLSPNELQVAELIREGRSSKEISNLLNISIHTVVSYRYCIRKKTGIKGRKINLRAYLQDMKS